MASTNGEYFEYETVFTEKFEKSFAKMFALQLSARLTTEYEEFVTYRCNGFASSKAIAAINKMYERKHEFAPKIIVPSNYKLSESTFSALSHILASQYLWEVS
jgi:hypothetical protein